MKNIIGSIKLPIIPENVLFGLYLFNFGPLKILPKQKPPISDKTQIVITNKNSL